jgi:GPH family glycoside/pentoside/hexuronide:cation symporter
MGWTIVGTLAGLLLGYYGFQANVVQSVGSLHGIRLLVSLIPAVAATLAAIVMYFYMIDEKKLKQISSDLAERRAQEAAASARA